MGGWTNKLAGLVARLAPVLHCTELLRRPWEAPVSLRMMESAIAFGHFGIEHARAAFNLMGSDPETEYARFLRNAGGVAAE
jgi:hypothetical protein